MRRIVAPTRERKGQRVAEAVGEEELGGREADVVFAQSEDRLAVELDGPIGVGVGMDGSLRPASRAGRIEPEGGVVGTGPGGPGEGRAAGEKGLELGLAEFERLGRARDDDLVDLVVGSGQRRLQHRFDRAADDRGLGARMLEHEGVVVGGEQGVDRNRDHAGEHRPQKGDRPVRAVEHEQHHALLALDAGHP